MKLLKKLQSGNREYVLFVHDSAATYIKEIKKDLAKLGYSDLLNLKRRQPYISYFNNGILEEYTGEGTISVILPWNVKLNKKVKLNNKANNNHIN